MKYIIFFTLFVFTFLSKAEGESLDHKKIGKIIWDSEKSIERLYANQFDDFVGKDIDLTGVKILLDSILKDLQSEGYYSSQVSFDSQVVDGNVNLKIKIQKGERTSLHFKGNSLLTFGELKARLSEKIRIAFGKIEEIELKNEIISAYEEKGFYDVDVVISKMVSRDKDKELINIFVFQIKEGHKIGLNSLGFKGLEFIKEEQLREIFIENGTPLSKAGYLDKKYLQEVEEILKKYYLSRGFVSVEISKAKIVYNDIKSRADVEYSINEKQQVTVQEIDVLGSPKEFTQELLLKLINKKDSPLNVVALDDDLKVMIKFLQDKGYLNVKIDNLNRSNLIVYDKANFTAKIQPNVNLGERICFRDLIISGNTVTKNEVISRENRFKLDGIISPDEIDKYRTNLVSLGLFSSVSITPVYTNEVADSCRLANLKIQVIERDFGQGELSLGYRTDLGIKAGTGLNFGNRQGMNRTFSVKGQVNQRLNSDGFDDRRRIADKRKMEFTFKLSYLEPYLFSNDYSNKVELETSTSFQRKRFYAFDADILKISPQISKSLNENWSISFKYQLEKIDQSDATETRDNDNFTIGGITPSINYENRDDPVYTRRGVSLNLSAEWANKFFLSMNNDDFEVNYMKIISRNKFYFPVGNFVFATSISGGYEENFTKKYYLPSIKVFRMDGFDEIRGFDNGEINRLLDGRELDKVTVNKNAYFVAYKFEPRYFLTDTIQANLFFDAGRVFIDSFKPLKLRSSVGLGIKFITPVGSLDFDYGVKLSRKSYNDNRRDSAGRFHLSIGFF